MSAFGVYLVMQMDNIGRAVEATGLLCLAATALCVVFWGVASEDNDCPHKGFAWVLSILIGSMLFIGAVSALIPSTKTMCALYTIPAITQNETIRADMSEVYTLGMSKLKDVLKSTENTEKGESK